MSVASVTLIAVGYFLCNLAFYLWNEHNLLTRKVSRWEWTFQATNTKYPKVYSHKKLRPLTYWAFDILDSRHLVQCCCGQYVLLLLRVLGMVYFAFVMLWQEYAGPKLTNDIGSAQYYLTWFTHWTFIGFGLYALLGFLVSVQALKSSRHNYPRPEQPPPSTSTTTPPHAHASAPTSTPSLTIDDKQRWPYNWLHKAFLITYVIIFPASITLTIFYWAVVFKGGREVLADDPMKHGGTVVLLLLELILSRIPIVSYHCQCCFIYGTVYVIFMWLYHAGTGIWRYTHLNYNLQYAPVYYALLPVLLIASFVLIYIIAAVREVVWTWRCDACRYCCRACKCYCCSDDVEAYPAEYMPVKRDKTPAEPVAVKRDGVAGGHVDFPAGQAGHGLGMTRG